MERLEDAGGGRFQPGLARSLFDLSNGARGAAKVAALAWHEELAATARAHAADLAHRSYVEHLSPEGFDPTDRLGLIGRRFLGSTSENIASRRGIEPNTADLLFGQWRRSPPHWYNLRRARHTHAGFGVVRKGERFYAVGLYARPDGALSVELPFQVERSERLLQAIDGVDPALRPLAFAAGAEEGPGYAVQAIGQAPSGAYQLQLERQLTPRGKAYILGPVFWWPGS